MSTSPTRRRFLHRGLLAAGALSLPKGAASGPRPAPAAEPAPSGGPAPASPRPRMHLGLVTYMIGAQMDLPTLIQTCEQAGIEGVELRTSHRHGVEPSLDAAGRARVRELFARGRVRLVGLGSTCEYHSPNPAELTRNVEQTRAFIQLAADVGARGVKVRPNALPPGVPEESTLRQIGAALAQCGAAAQERNVELWLEIHGSGTSHPPRVRRIMELANHPAVGLCWNSNGSDVQNGSVREHFELCRPWIRHVHINELTSGYPWRELFTLLKAMSYDRFTMIEAAATTDPVRVLRYYRSLWETMAL